MWNWTLIKSLGLTIISILVLIFAGFSIKASIIVSVGFNLFAGWIIKEINFIRKAHGTNLEELDAEIEELKISKKENATTLRGSKNL